MIDEHFYDDKGDFLDHEAFKSSPHFLIFEGSTFEGFWRPFSKINTTELFFINIADAFSHLCGRTINFSKRPNSSKS